jgi:lipopolysaccharide transport system ATP-binding protein
MKKREIDRKFDEIVAFAEAENFLDTPVKRYSSGMYVRLAFAVAAHLQAEILLVDELLAVGDVGFQKKCLGKMREVGVRGRIVLFVSHNMAALRNLCQRAILLESGRIVQEGSAEEVVQDYLDSFNEGSGISLENRKDRYGDGRLRITHLALADAQGKPVNCLRSGEGGQIVAHYRSVNQDRFKDVLVYIRLFTPAGERLCDFETDFTGDNFEEIGPIGRFVCYIPRVPLQAGSYPFSVSVYSSGRILLDQVAYGGRIKVEQGDFYGSGRMPNAGVLFVDHSWQYLAED